MTKFNICFFILLLLVTETVTSQNLSSSNCIAVKIGYGTIESNSPTVNSLSLGFAYVSTFGISPLPIKLEYQLHKRIEYFLPGKSFEQVYPHLQSFSVSAIVTQIISLHSGINFDIGYVLIHDKFFDDVNTFSNGFNFNVSAFYLTSYFNYKIGFNYGFGITSNAPSYSNIYISLSYLLQ